MPVKDAARPRSSARLGLLCSVAAGLVLVLGAPALADERDRSSAGAETLADSETSLALQEMVAWVRATTDNQGLPYLVIDKVEARALAFDGEGRLLGAAPVLLGLARGDISPPGIGDRPLSAIAPEERVTPSGRFLAAMGENLAGGSILWIDYDTALSLHPVITTRSADRRLERLATATPEDNRISYGCVNVPADFYENVVRPAFAGTMGVVYILPEHQSIAEVFRSASDPSATAPGELPLD